MLVLAAALVYSDSFHGPFIFDDNPAIAQTAAKRPWPVWHTLIGQRPAVQATLALNYFIGGSNETGYHVANLCIHILAALALFGVIRRTLTLPVARRPVRREGRHALAFCSGAALGAPSASDRVGHVHHPADGIADGAFLSSDAVLLYPRGTSPIEALTAKTRRHQERQRSFCSWCLGVLVVKGWYAAAVAACALGMGSKEVMVSAPLLVLLYDRTFIAGSFREALRRRWGLYLALAATWPILAR